MKTAIFAKIFCAGSLVPASCLALESPDIAGEGGSEKSYMLLIRREHAVGTDITLIEPVGIQAIIDIVQVCRP